MKKSDARTDDETHDQSPPSLWHRLRARRWVRWAMDIAIVVVIIGLISAFQTRHLLGDDDPLPPAELEALDGSTISLDELDTRRTVIYFWATWCGACDLQSGAISSLHERAGDDLTVISVVLQYGDRSEVADHVKNEDIDYPVYLGTPGLAQRFRVESYPTIYIIDDELRIRHGLVGYTTGIGLRARVWL